MQVILLENVESLGDTGDHVTVKPGYARNYLLPRGLAVEANARNARSLRHNQEMVAARVLRQRKAAEGLAGKVKATEIHIPVLVGEDDRLFGSVTNRDIEAALSAQGIDIDRKKIVVAEPIRALGPHAVQVKLHKDVTVDIEVWVDKRE